MLLRVTHERRARGLKRYELAAVVGMESEALRLIESGRAKPTPAQRVDLAAALEWKGEPAALFEAIPSITRAELERRRQGLTVGDIAYFTHAPEAEVAAILAGERRPGIKEQCAIAEMLQYRGNLFELFEEVPAETINE